MKLLAGFYSCFHERLCVLVLVCVGWQHFYACVVLRLRVTFRYLFVHCRKLLSIIQHSRGELWHLLSLCVCVCLSRYLFLCMCVCVGVNVTLALFAAVSSSLLRLLANRLLDTRVSVVKQH